MACHIAYLALSCSHSVTVPPGAQYVNPLSGTDQHTAINSWHQLSLSLSRLHVSPSNRFFCLKSINIVSFKMGLNALNNTYKVVK